MIHERMIHERMMNDHGGVSCFDSLGGFDGSCATGPSLVLHTKREREEDRSSCDEDMMALHPSCEGNEARSRMTHDHWYRKGERANTSLCNT